MDGTKRGTVAVAAHDEPVEPVHPVLQAGRAGIVGSHVLEEQELAAGPQHPSQLPQRPGLIVGPAQDQRRDGHVEGVIVEGKVLGRRPQDLGGRAVLADLALQAAQHRKLRLGYRQRLDGRAIAGQVGARPAADLDHTAFRSGEQGLPEGTQPGLLGPGYLAVVGQGEELGPQAHGSLLSARLRSLTGRT